MDKLFKKINILIVLTIIVLILFFYFGVFSPLKTELEITLDKNFEHTVDITEMNIENKLNRYIEGAESISSRSMIRNEIEIYQLGEISFVELQTYTEEKYKDGVKVLNDIVAAFRITDNQIITQWGNNDLREFSDYIRYSNEKIEMTILKPESFIIVNSPIIKDKQKLGHDIIVYDIKTLMKEIDKNSLTGEIILREAIPEDYETRELIVKHRKLLDTNYWLKLNKTKKALYQSLNNLSYKIIVVFFILIVFIIILFYNISKKTSDKVISQLETKVKQITEISETDDMLGIYNRSKFFKYLKSDIYRCKRYKQSLSLIMIDVDHFKAINDSHGHLVGDDVLKKLSRIIEKEIRANDLFVRYGGDEFMLLMPETDLKEAINLGNRLKELLENEKFDEVEQVSCSFGVTALKTADDIDSLILRVDKALYEAKENRNSVSFLK